MSTSVRSRKGTCKGSLAGNALQHTTIVTAYVRSVFLACYVRACSLCTALRCLGGLPLTILLEVLTRHSPATVKGVEVLQRQLKVLLFGVTTADGASRSPIIVRTHEPNNECVYTVDRVLDDLSAFPEGTSTVAL